MEPRGQILVVEDDDVVGAQLVDLLEGAGFDTTWLRSASAAAELPLSRFLLTILDLVLPDRSGLDLLRELRRESTAPVLVLSALDDTAEKVRALELGADDYVTKPFWPEELLARVHARLRRPGLERDGIVLVGGLTIDLTGRRVWSGGDRVDLTRVEFDVLAALARRPGAAITRRWLMENVLDPEREGTERTLDVHVSRLRKKLGPAGRSISTVWGIGYRLDPPS